MADAPKKRRVRVVVHGRVQGVSFRAHTRAQALSLRLDGWVRNRADGAVEALLSGPEDRVAQMLTWLGHGAPPAIVASLSLTEVAESVPAPGFDILF